MRCGRQLALALLALLLLAVPGVCQTQLGDNTEITLQGVASFGYNGIFSDVDSNQLVYGVNADLTGWYYNPKFLSFRVSPYYNQSRLNSSYNSIFGSQGFTATANLFGGSHTPVDFSYEREWNSEGTFTVPGASGYTTKGNGQSFSVGAGLNFEGFPLVHGSLSLMKNQYGVIGSEQNGATDARAFNIGATYSRWGFNFGGGYGQTHIAQDTPFFFQPVPTRPQDSDQDTLQFNASRQLWKNATFASSFTRTHYITDYSGTLSENRYNTVNASLGWRPLDKLTVGFAATYTTNLGAYLFGTLLPGVPNAPPPIPLNRNSDYLTFGGRATYILNADWTLDGGADHNSQNFLGFDQSANNLNGGVGYHHALAGGQFAAHYGLSYYSGSTNNATSTGHSTSLSYSRDVSGWRTTSGVQCNTNVMTSLLGYRQTGYGVNLSASHRVSSWFLNLAARAAKTSVTGLSDSDGLSTGVSAALSRNKFSVNGSYNRSNGESIPTIGGLVPTPLPGSIIPPGLLIAYNGTSYALGAGYQPVRRLRLSGSYSHSLYSTDQLQLSSNNMFTRLDTRVEYSFRQLELLGSFTHLRQGLGVDFSHPQTVNAVYFGVSRRFTIF